MTAKTVLKLSEDALKAPTRRDLLHLSALLVVQSPVLDHVIALVREGTQRDETAAEVAIEMVTAELHVEAEVPLDVIVVVAQHDVTEVQ